MTKIAITGHRFLAEIEKIGQGIDTCLSKIETTSSKPFTIISSLAEGADQFLVQRALNRWPDAHLIVPLPLSETIYQDQFTSPASRVVFGELFNRADQILPPPEASNFPEAYQLAGHQMLEMSDVLIAVWDGQDTQGIGGTGEIVQTARARTMPILWIHAGNRKPGTNQPTSLGEEQGTVSFEGF